jgi:hypothetical protein
MDVSGEVYRRFSFPIGNPAGGVFRFRADLQGRNRSRLRSTASTGSITEAGAIPGREVGI